MSRLTSRAAAPQCARPDFHPFLLSLGGLLCALGCAVAVWPGAARAAASAASPAASAASAVRAAMTVTVAAPQRQSLAGRISANGNVAAWQEMSASAEVGGLRVRELLAQVGDSVKAGQVLAVLDDESVAADVRLARAAVAEGEAQAREASANAQRARQLEGGGFYSAQQIGQLLTAEQAARARVEMAQAQLAQQELRARNTRVRAPDAGVVTARAVTLGAVAQPGVEMFRLLRQGRLEWRAEVTAAELPRVRVGQAAQVHTADNRSLSGRVRQIAPTVDPQTRNALVYVDLPGAGAALRPGQFARGELLLESSDALTVPSAALVLREGFHHAFVLKGADRVESRRVQLGRRQGERVEVLQGLKGDEQVVVAGAGFLNDGDKVKVVR